MKPISRRYGREVQKGLHNPEPRTRDVVFREAICAVVPATVQYGQFSAATLMRIDRFGRGALDKMLEDGWIEHVGKRTHWIDARYRATGSAFDVYKMFMKEALAKSECRPRSD
jgi:hypothetical protein